jgi:hypothetical protein
VHLKISERILRPVGPTQVIRLVGKPSEGLGLSVDMHGTPFNAASGRSFAPCLPEVR